MKICWIPNCLVTKGAFTGAQNVIRGDLNVPTAVRYFFDELATAPMMVQEKLLRVIEYGELERRRQPAIAGECAVGMRDECRSPAMVNEGTFRADLLDRLAFDVVQLPPLRERESDIMLMAEHFAIQMCREIKLPLFLVLPSTPEKHY